MIGAYRVFEDEIKGLSEKGIVVNSNEDGIYCLMSRKTAGLFEDSRKILIESDFEYPKIEDEKEAIIQDVYAIRQAKIYQESIPYIFPGDTDPDGIQFRDEIDRQNIQDIGHVAQFHINNNEPDFPMFFMARSNTLKTFTATQALEMCALLKLRGDVIYQRSWELKQQIEAVQTLEELYNININTGWPE